jgi:ATP-dependent exoDNAse (exonuclease V) beta subunit
MANEPLTIYKASAGSGKTFTIAYNYIKKLIEDPTSAGKILAVTFTNKATGEMKTRILSQLYGLWKGLKDDDTDKFSKKLHSDFKISETAISTHAGLALKNILYNYNTFQVETIDAFFQTVLRNLANELNLTPNLRVDLNETQVEAKAVDTIIDNLHPNDKVLGWIMDYISDSISKEKDWNIISQIKSFGKNLFRDIYKSRREDLNKMLNNEQEFNNYVGYLVAIRKKKDEQLRMPAEEFEKILMNAGADIKDFSSGSSGACGYFIKLKKGDFDDDILNKTAVKAMDDANCWVTKAHQKPGDPLLQLAKEKLTPLLRQTESSRKELLLMYKSADTTIKHLHQLRLLDTIGEEIQQMNSSANRFFLSDTQTLLHEMMKDTDTPFIFEKIGSRIEHIMIDEFQDTSLIQWCNFKTLLLECMSHAESDNLIVGDIKQSIYRWRNGDWKLLYNIKGEFSNPDNQLKFEPLDINYRSEPNIVHFNNSFFKEASEIEYQSLSEENTTGAEQIKLAYSDVEQKASKEKNNDGYVNIQLLPKENYENTSMELLVKTIKDILSSGYGENSIAIILRSNSDIQFVADYLSRNMPEVSLVSDEAFKLDSSNAVNIIIDALQLLVTPNDALLTASLAQAYQNIIGEEIPKKEFLSGHDNLKCFLPKAYTDSFNDLSLLPLADLVDSIYRIFKLEQLEEQNAYVCTFLDYLNDFVTDNGSNISDFLDYWKETVHEKTIQSDEANGIRLITVHKSKGLQFENVIMPICDWTLEHPGNILWCEPKTEPFNELPLVPIDYSAKQMMSTIFEEDYFNEHLQNTMDNLNMLYVGFTRAKRNLFISGKRGNNKGTRTLLIEKTLSNLNLIDTSLNADETLETNTGTFCYPKTEEEEEHTENIFLKLPTKKELTVKAYEKSGEFRQSNKSKEFVEGEDSSKQSEYIKTGSIMHKIFSMIATPDDIDYVLETMEMDGILYGDGLSKEKIEQMIKQRLQNKTVADWFSGRWKLYNECSILSEDPTNGAMKVHRPDRVMMYRDEVVVVDFKFGHPMPEYKDQVSTYITLLKGMGYNNVKGYLWYVYSNDVEDV